MKKGHNHVILAAAKMIYPMSLCLKINIQAQTRNQEGKQRENLRGSEFKAIN